MATRAVLVTIPAGTTVDAETVEEFDTPAVETVLVGINVTAASGTDQTLQPYIEVLGSDGIWYSVWKLATAISAAGQTVGVVGTSLVGNAGTTGEAQASPVAWTGTARLRLEVGGTSPSFTLSATVYGN